MPAILDGVTVLDLSTGPAAALATMMLSDQGARVIRVVEHDAPIFRHGGFIVWDRGKERMALNFDNDVNGFEKLVAGADVLVEDFAPNSKRQSLVDDKILRPINPLLINCSITAYGKRGALKDDPPIEDLVLARMGVLGGMPGFRPPPVHVVHPLPTVGSALLACLGIAAALLARETTGRGRTVATSMMAGALLFHPKVIGENLDDHVFQTHPSGSTPFYSVYQCADGNWLQLGCVHDRFISTAAGLIGIGDLVAEPRFNGGGGNMSAQDEQILRDTLTHAIAAKPLASWSKVFEEADVPFAPVRQTRDGLEDPQVIHNGMVVTLDDPEEGSVTQMGVPLNFSETPAAVLNPRSGENLDVLLDRLTNNFSVQETPDKAPLSGIRILEITNLIAGPTGGRLLADLGADVIKLEPHTGDLSRPIGRTYFYNLNFNKRSISVDAGTDAGRRVVQRIAAISDVLLANLRPGATARMGIGTEINPNLIETHLTGYGASGPYAKRPGIDPLAQALMGMSQAQGGLKNQPVFPAQLAPTDYTTGAMGAFGTVLALYARTRYGIVQRVDSNLLNGAALLSSAWFTAYDRRPERPLADKEQYGLTPYHRLFQMRDGWIYVVAHDATQQKALCHVAGVDWVANFEGKHPNETSFARELAAALSSRSVAETIVDLKKVGIPVAETQMGDSELFLDDPHTQENDLVATVQHPTAGKLMVAHGYIRFGNTEVPEPLPTPLLGGQTSQVLREAGYSEAEICTLYDDKIVLTETT